MGGFLGFLGSIWSSLGTAGQSILKFGAMVALDAIAALMGGRSQHGPQLKNKTIASSTYGHPLPRARGTVRLNGQLIFWNHIQETTHEKKSGGFFGLGGQSIFTYTYSTCCAFAFGKKLGGGQAVKFIRIWADGKLLYSRIVSDAALTGTATVVGTVPADSQAIPVSISGGGSLTLSAGDLIQFGNYVSGVFVPAGANTYEVQQDVTLGSGATGQIDVYPAIDQDFTGQVLFIPGLTSPVVDLSSFDPNPHDGSHVVKNKVPNGSIRFHYGTPTEQPDPIIVQQFGAGQAAAYRGLPYVMLSWLQLANYGNHVPSISAEIAFDTATGKFPIIGPIPDPSTMSGLMEIAPTTNLFRQVCSPFAGASATLFSNELLTTGFIWVFSQNTPGGPIDAYCINTTTNTIYSSLKSIVTSSVHSSFCVDNEGYVYVADTSGTVSKFDGFSWSAVASCAAVNGDMDMLFCWDVEATLFGNPVRLRLLAAHGHFGDVAIYDRSTMTAFGTPDCGGSNTKPVVVGYIGSGDATVGALGSYIDLATSSGNVANGMTVDAAGNLWVNINGIVSRYHSQFSSGIMPVKTDFLGVPLAFLNGGAYDCTFDPHTLKPALYLPNFARTDISIFSITGATSGPIYYNSSDDSIIAVGHNGIAKISCASLSVVASNTSVPWTGTGIEPSAIYPDILGSVVVEGARYFYRVDVNSLAIVDTYDINAWLGANGPGGGSWGSGYDQVTDSLWYNYAGHLYRLYLDRGAGDGIGLDQIVASIFSEAGYESSEYDVTALSTITTQGYEVDQQPFLDSIKMLEELFLFDMADIDGKLICVPRSAGAGVVIILEDDLGATDIGTAPVARLSETLQQEVDVPETVWVHYYDTTKQLQQATQYDKRISQPYASALTGKPKVTNSRNQLVISTPVTDSPGPMKLQARRILLDHWQARGRQQFKTGIKYIRLDPTDKIQLSYKGITIDSRLTAVDRGAGFALQFQGESYDSGVYSVPADVTRAGGGTTSGLPGPIPVTTGFDNYTVSPPYPLSQTSTTNLALARTVASFTSGLRTQYEPRPTLTIADPGSGNTQIYYVTIYDPTFSGEAIGTISLTSFVATTPSAAHVGEHGYINMGSIVAAGAGATTSNGQPAGQPEPASGQLVAEIAFGPTTRGNFTVAHNLVAMGLGPIPSDVQVQITVGGDMGSVEFQALRYDAQNIYLVASEDGLSGYLEIFA